MRATSRAGLDDNNENVLAIAVGLSFYAGLFQLVDGLMIVYANGLRGLRDTRGPFWISMIGYWFIGFGVGTFLGFGLEMGAPGVWWGLIAGGIVATLLMYARFHKRMVLTEQRLATDY